MAYCYNYYNYYDTYFLSVLFFKDIKVYGVIGITRFV